MKAWAVGVPAREAESTRQTLLREGQLRADLRVLRRGGQVWLPIHAAGGRGGPSGAVEMEFPDPLPPRPRGYQELVDLPAPLHGELPRAFDVVGEIVLIRIPENLRPHAPAIGAALRAFVPGARLVVEDRGVAGPERTRQLVRLAGDGPFVTVHHENGLTFEVDLERAYFSPRLAREHERIARLVPAGEAVLDLCCGVAPFALTIARRQPECRVNAVDSNARAIELATGNARRNHVAARVAAEVAEARLFLETAPTFDRIVLNLPHEGHRFFPGIARCLRPGGTLHYYSILPRTGQESELVARLAGLGRADGWRVLDRHRVHPYSPTHDLVANMIMRVRV